MLLDTDLLPCYCVATDLLPCYCVGDSEDDGMSKSRSLVDIWSETGAIQILRTGSKYLRSDLDMDYSSKIDLLPALQLLEIIS